MRFVSTRPSRLLLQPTSFSFPSHSHANTPSFPPLLLSPTQRESLAILALEKSISIEPASPSPYLALAVSHTNNNDRLSTFSALESWITHSAQANPAYAASLAEAKKREIGLAAGGKERFDWIVGALVGFARNGNGQEGGVDADVQIALGVLFNTSGVSAGGGEEGEEQR